MMSPDLGLDYKRITNLINFLLITKLLCIFADIAKIHKFLYMSTYRELTSLVMDELKLVSDDSHFVEEHVVFLLDKYRIFLLKQRYADIRKEIPESNYQTICVDLEHVTDINGVQCTGVNYLKSVQKIPHLMSVGSQRISTLDFFQGNINYVSSERFKYVGHNKYLRNQAYGTIAPDSHLYLRSNNPQMYYLRKVRVTGIFEDSAKAAELQCPDDEGNVICDVMDMTFPLEESLVPPLVELIVKELSAFKYQAQDSINNANDDLSNLAAYIRQQVAEGKRSDLYKNP